MNRKLIIRGLVSLISIVFFSITFTANADIIPEDVSIVTNRISQLEPKIPQDHPRLLIVKSELPQFRSFIQEQIKAKKYVNIFNKAILEPENLPLPMEPPRLPEKNSSQYQDLWQEAMDTSFYTSSQAQRYAFSYLVTGEEKYGREAARWLMHLASWDVNGGIDLYNNDEAFIQSLRPMIFAYDWAYDTLTDSERSFIKEALGIRLKILFDYVTNNKGYNLSQPLSTEDFSSHALRFISHIGIGGLVLYNELPESSTYLAWTYEYYLRQFPIWGGDNGGWSEGMAYWWNALNQHFFFLDAMKSLNLDEIYHKAFFRNTGYFALYNLTPFPTSSFGDLSNFISPNLNTGITIEKLALEYNDPYLLKYFQTINKGYPSGINYYNFSFFESIFHLYRKSQKNYSFEPKDLGELPRSRFFEDIGWVAMHNQLGSGDDVMLGFKSSGYGSVSHSHADQNSFVLSAYGEPLAISSGYRDFFGSPHQKNWAWTTISKNAVLFGVQGQESRDPKATGKITSFYSGRNFDFVSGDATQAYYMLGTVKKAVRQIFFVNHSYFLVHDDLKSGQPTTYQWLLHSMEPMEMDSFHNQVIIKKGNANLLVKFLSPTYSKLTYQQTDQFTTPVSPDCVDTMPNQWHFTASTIQPSASQQFLTLLFPYNTTAQYDLPKITNQNAGCGFSFLVQRNQMRDWIFISKNIQDGVISDTGTLNGVAGFVTLNGSQLSTFALIKGTKFDTSSDIGINIQADQPINLEGEFTSNQSSELRLNIRVKEQTEIQIKLPFIPYKINGISSDRWNFDQNNRILRLQLADNANLIINQ